MMVSPTEWLLDLCQDSEVAAWVMRQPTDDRLANALVTMIAAETLAQVKDSKVTGFIGRILTAVPHRLIEHLVELNKQFYPNTEFIGRFGSLRPFPIVELEQATAYIKEFEPETYQEMRLGGMFTPAAIFDRKLYEKSETFTLIASGDVRGSITDGSMRAGRHLLKQLTSVGCSVILTYNDPESLELLDGRNFFGTIKTFDLGSW